MIRTGLHGSNMTVGTAGPIRMPKGKKDPRLSCYNVVCPVCGVPKGRYCVNTLPSRAGERRKEPHQARRDLVEQ